MIQILSVAGATVLLAAFGLLQSGRLDSDSISYQLANLLGAGALFVVAVIEWQLGFMLLEGAWTVISAAGLFRRRSVTSGEVV